MTRYGNYLQFLVAYRHDIPVVESVAHGRRFLIQREAEHPAILSDARQEKRILLAGLRAQSELPEHERIAKHMIQVQVRVQQMAHRQPIVRDKLLQRLLFFLVVASGINDSRLQCLLVPHHVAVDGKHIEFK